MKIEISKFLCQVNAAIGGGRTLSQPATKIFDVVQIKTQKVAGPAGVNLRAVCGGGGLCPQFTA